jgi:hypothetical protein
MGSSAKAATKDVRLLQAVPAPFATTPFLDSTGPIFRLLTGSRTKNDPRALKSVLLSC